MLGRKQINFNAPYLYLIKREGAPIFDLFILIEVFSNAKVVFPEINQLPQNVTHPEINISILLNEPELSAELRWEAKRYTFDLTDEEDLTNKKIIARTLIDKVGGEVFRRMEMYFKDSDEGPIITQEAKIATDSPYLYLNVSNGEHGHSADDKSRPMLAFSPNILIPTYGGKLLKAGFNGYYMDGDIVESWLLFEESIDGQGKLELKRINQATVYAKAGAERSFSIELLFLPENGPINWSKFNPEKDTDKKKKAKTRHGNSSKGKGGQAGGPQNE